METWMNICVTLSALISSIIALGFSTFDKDKGKLTKAGYFAVLGFVMTAAVGVLKEFDWKEEYNQSEEQRETAVREKQTAQQQRDTAVSTYESTLNAFAMMDSAQLEAALRPRRLELDPSAIDPDITNPGQPDAEVALPDRSEFFPRRINPARRDTFLDPQTIDRIREFTIQPGALERELGTIEQPTE